MKTLILTVALLAPLAPLTPRAAVADDIQRATISTLVYEIQTYPRRGLGRLVGSVEYGTPCGKVLLAEGYGKYCAIDRDYIEFGITLPPWVRVVAKCAATQ